MRRLVSPLAVVTTLGMFVVLVMGALVTNTGSGHGCANTWPLCDGKVIPGLSFTTGQATLIEFSHRAVTAVETVLILSFAAVVVVLYRRRRETWALVPAMIVFLFAQAILGAIAAGTHETPEILALHFGVSLIAFASIVLTAAFVLEAGGADRVRDRPIPAPIRSLGIIALVYTYIVVYLGAYVVHVGASLACADWPLCNGTLVPGEHAPYIVLVQYVHRVAAALLALLVLALWAVARRWRRERPDLYRGAIAALVSVVLQTLSGGLLVVARLNLVSRLLHAGLVSLLFASLCYIVYHFVTRRSCLPRAHERATQIVESSPSEARAT